MRILGRHLIVEYCDCDRASLDNIAYLEHHMNEAVRRSGATIVRSVFHRYNPQGVSGAVIIAESHFSIHSWPEYGYASVDFFTCGDSVDPMKAAEYMKEMLGAEHVDIKELRRGIPSDVDEVINHKPIDSPLSAAS
ncbi:S-adenosylmethionine decarboxylase proenzyme [candidate division GN15 bacterium]|nr:S-adenosylmethionine decarboxylase proenzyme [candidate division GN15 bacterium]